MDNFVRFVANAGVLTQYDGIRILIDALHTHKTERFSRTRQKTLEDIIYGRSEFTKINYLLITHEHQDHYDEMSVISFMQNHPETVIITPTEISGSGTKNLKEQKHVFEFDNTRITAQKLPHEGEEYADSANYGFIIEINDKNLVVFGDSVMYREVIQGFIDDKEVEIAFLNFPFVTVMRGKETVRHIIKPKQNIIFHLPFEEDDRNGYVKTARHITNQDGESMPPYKLLYKPDQIESL